MLEALFAQIDDQRDALVELTRELIQIPTVNPPGEAYGACAAARRTPAPQRLRGLYLRAEGAPGDSDRYPRLNVVARHEGRGPAPCVHFNSHIDVVEGGHGWSRRPVRRRGPGRPDLRPRHLRHEGRPRRCDRRRSRASSRAASSLPGALEMSGTVDEESGGFGGVAWLAGRATSLGRASTTSSSPSRSASTASASAIAASGGPRSRPTGGSPTARCRSSATARSATWRAFLDRLESDLLPRLAGRTTAMPVVPDGARPRPST